MANGSFGLSGFPTASPTVQEGTELSFSTPINYYERSTIYTAPSGKSARVISLTASTLNGSAVSFQIIRKRGATETIIYGPNQVNSYAATTYYPAKLNINPVEGNGFILESGDELLVETTSTAPNWYRYANTTISAYDYQFYNPYYLNSLWLIPAYKYATNQAVLLYSSDGNTWSESVIGSASQRLVFAAYGNGYYAVCAVNASSNAFFYTTNLAGAWTSINISGATEVNSFAYAANRFVLATGATISDFYVSPSNTPTSFSAILKPKPYNQIDTGEQAFLDVIDVDSNAVIAGSSGVISTTNFTSWDNHGIAMSGSRGSGTWALTAAGNGFYNSLAINPTNGDYFVPTTLDPANNNAALLQTSVVKSTDGGVNWSLVALPTTYSAAGQNSPVYYINQTTNSNHFYIPSIYSTNGTRPIYYSTDSGSTWSVALKTGLNATVFQNGAQTKFSPILSNSIFVASVNTTAAPIQVCQLASGTFNVIANLTFPASVQPGNATGFPATYSPTTGKYYVFGNNLAQLNYATSTNGTSWSGWTTTTSFGSSILQGACPRPGGQGFLIASSSGVAVYTSDTATAPTYTHVIGNVIGMTVSGDTATSEIVVITTTGASLVSTDQGVTFSSTISGAVYVPGKTAGSGNFILGAYDTFRSRHVGVIGNAAGQTFYSSNGFYWNSAVISYPAGSKTQSQKLLKTTNYVYLIAESAQYDRIPRSGTFANNMAYGTAVQYPSSLGPSYALAASRGINSGVVINDKMYYDNTLGITFQYNPVTSVSSAQVNVPISQATSSLALPSINTSNVTAWGLASDGTNVLLTGVNVTTSMTPGNAGASLATPLSSVVQSGTLTTNIIEQEV